MNDLAVIVLAAGKGVRMRSDLPKVFHEILGEPMLTYVLETVKQLNPQRTYLVVGHKRDLLMDYYKEWPLSFVAQDEQLGTGHAVMQVKPYLDDFTGMVLVLAGDVPLLSAKTLKQLIDFHLKNRSAATDLTAVLADAANYGRIVRQANGEILKIVEKKDATAEELKIKEINTGTFCFDKEALFLALKEVKPENAQKEYYLTDTIEILRKKGLPVYACRAEDPLETLGINTKEELVAVEKILLGRQA
ncbi:MAG: NTP transferase domain-containing protein [Candidatus Margulisbacteria bacterium]|nr:NTP transferase domain-containing protein [Candidatus Margulisiibacteriota bacterium]